MSMIQSIGGTIRASTCVDFGINRMNHSGKQLLQSGLIAALLGCCATLACAQYVTPGEVQRQKDEQQRQRDDNEANAYIGKTFWYVPNPEALNRVKFLSAVPAPGLNEGDSQFFPISSTSFVVTQVDGIESNYSPLLDKRYLRIRFPDNKTGYIDVKELTGHMYQGERYEFEEYLYPRPPAAIVAERTDSIISPKTRAAPRIGMTKEQVLASTWGKPNKINKASGTPGAREQWVYGSRYLYFENSILVGIDK
jgi:hypothetical protein